MNTNSTHLSMCEDSVAKLMTNRSESQDDMNKSTADYEFCKMNPGRGRQRGIVKVIHVAKFGDPYLELVLCVNPSKVHTHSSEHTPGAVGSQCCGTRGAVGGLVPCSRAHQSWY